MVQEGAIPAMSDRAARALSRLLSSLTVLSFAASLDRSVLAQETLAFPEDATFADMVELPFVGLLPDDPRALADPEAYFTEKIRKWELAPVKLHSGITIARPPALPFEPPADYLRFHPQHRMVTPVLELLGALPKESLQLLVEGGVADITAFRDRVHEILTVEDEQGNLHIQGGMKETAFASAPLICAQVHPFAQAVLRSRGPGDPSPVVITWSESRFKPAFAQALDGVSAAMYTRENGLVPPSGTLGWYADILPVGGFDPHDTWCDAEVGAAVWASQQRIRLADASGASLADLANALQPHLPHPIAVDGDIRSLRLWVKPAGDDDEVALVDLADAALACCWARYGRDDPEATVPLADLKGKTTAEVANLASAALGVSLEARPDRADRVLGDGPRRPLPWTQVASMVLGVDWPGVWWDQLTTRPVYIHVDPTGRQLASSRGSSALYSPDADVSAQGLALLGGALHRSPQPVPERWRSAREALSAARHSEPYPALPLSVELLRQGWSGRLSQMSEANATAIREAVRRELAAHPRFEHWVSFVAFPVLNADPGDPRAEVDLHVGFWVSIWVCGVGGYGNGQFGAEPPPAGDLAMVGGDPAREALTAVGYTRSVY